MATSISSADLLHDKDYSVAHRPAPPIPMTYGAISVSSRSAHGVKDRSDEVNGEYRRRGSLGSLLHRSSSRSRSQPRQADSDSDIPPIPTRTPRHIRPAASPSYDHQRSVSGSRKASGEGRNMLRKVSSRVRRNDELERLEQERLARLHEPAPRLPSHNPLPGIGSVGNEPSYLTSAPSPKQTNFSRPVMPSSSTNGSSSPAYAVRPSQASSSPEPRGRAEKEYVGSSMARGDSMANRGRYSYASSTVPVNASSPRRIRRRKDPTPFNILVIGAKNSGKTSLIQFLQHSLALKSNSHHSPESYPTSNAARHPFTPHYVDTELDGERVGLTMWDSAGLEKSIVDLQLREITAFVDSKFEDTFLEEQKVNRSPGIKDTHIHCVFLVLDPVRLDASVTASNTSQKNGVKLATVNGLDDDFDLQTLRALWGKTTVIPVVAKADTLTSAHTSFLKRAVWGSIKSARLDPLEALELEDDTEQDDDADDGDTYEDAVEGYADGSEGETDSTRPESKAKKSHNRQSSLVASSTSFLNDEDTPYIPMSILTPDPYDSQSCNKAKISHPTKVGRRYPWGFVDPNDPEHCDFTRLRDSVFIEWRLDLRELSRTKWYENWRTSRLNNLPGSRHRVKGGVTPVNVVPKEGRTSPSASRVVSNPVVNGDDQAVPRSASGTSTNAGAFRSPSKAERLMGIESRNGRYKNVQT